MKQYETICEVTVNIKVNGVILPRNYWQSNESHDVCWRRIEKYIKENSKEGDVILKEIASTSQKSYLLTEPSL